MSLFNRSSEAIYVCEVLEEYKKLNVSEYHSDIREHIEKKYKMDLILNRLPYRQQECLRLTNIQGLFNKHAATKINISLRTLERIKSQAYENLYSLLTKDQSIPYGNHR